MITILINQHGVCTVLSVGNYQDLSGQDLACFRFMLYWSVLLGCNVQLLCVSMFHLPSKCCITLHCTARYQPDSLITLFSGSRNNLNIAEPLPHHTKRNIPHSCPTPSGKHKPNTILLKHHHSLHPPKPNLAHSDPIPSGKQKKNNINKTVCQTHNKLDKLAHCGYPLVWVPWIG